MALSGKAKKIMAIAGILVVVVLLALVIFISSLGRIIKAGIETVGSAVTKCDITVEKVDFSLLRGKLAITKLIVGNPEGYHTPSAFELDLVKVSLVPSSVLSDTVILKEIIIDGPQVTYEAGLGNSNMGTIQKNIAAFLPAGETTESTKEEPKVEAGTGKKIVIDHFLFENAQINLSVKLLQGKALPVPLPKIETQGLGRAQDGGQDAGLDAAEAVAVVMNQVLSGVISSATEAIAQLGNIGSEAVKDVVDGIGSGIKGLLKKGTDKLSAPAAPAVDKN